MAETIVDFFDQIKAEKTPSSPEPSYNPYGDCVHYHWRQDEFYADRIDSKLTVYRSIASNEAVGCQIKGITALIARLGDFGIAINEQDGTPLAMFLFASQAAAESPSGEKAADYQKIYKYLLEQAGKVRVEIKQTA